MGQLNVVADTLVGRIHAIVRSIPSLQKSPSRFKFLSAIPLINRKNSPSFLFMEFESIGLTMTLSEESSHQNCTPRIPLGQQFCGVCSIAARPSQIAPVYGGPPVLGKLQQACVKHEIETATFMRRAMERRDSRDRG